MKFFLKFISSSFNIKKYIIKYIIKIFFVLKYKQIKGGSIMGILSYLKGFFLGEEDDDNEIVDDGDEDD